MHIWIYFQLIGLITVSLITAQETQETNEESCIAQNATYALCIVNGENVTVVSESYSIGTLATECHEHFIEEALGKPACEEETHTDHEGPTDAQRYGYGFLAVFVVSAMSLGGLLAFPCLYKVSFQYVLATFTALAVGTLFGDAMFHLIPFALGLHSHESGAHEHGHEHEHEHEDKGSSVTVEDHQWKMFIAVMILYGFYLLEVFLHWFAHARENKNVVHTQGHNHQHNYIEPQPTLVCIGRNCTHHKSEFQAEPTENVNSNHNHSRKTTRVTGWMIIIGDGIHNFADGLAMGAAFSEDLLLGLTTTIAIGCHELPHEFGDYAVLIQSGFSHCKALMWNFISATTAFIGFFVGAAVSTNESARQWIFAVTIGMFLYIALVDLLPTLLPEGRIELKRFILVNIGFLFGIAIMFVLAIVEDKLIDLGH
ncbi:unnamed protein product [Adineta ricciae]|uniref:Uncharacterized protein n=1 Tax=Adineta ricciae TaxID=249248 RepID=A0A814V1Z0_ADIRI|nr:unnamed protein product [Adineta ricciae]